MARIDNGAVDVRLITVRQYASRSRSSEIPESDRLKYLLFFPCEFNRQDEAGQI